MMDKQYGYVIYSGLDQQQVRQDDPDLNSFLIKNKVQKVPQFKNSLAGYFSVAASPRVSQVFMDVVINEYMTVQDKIRRVPVFGAKGKIEGITRASNYVELFFTDSDNLYGAEFGRHIFGTKYLTSAELTDLSEKEIMERMQQKPEGGQISPSIKDVTKAWILLEKLWEVQEKNPATRLIVLMNDAGTESAPVLSEVYRMIPNVLRRQVGFETNIGQEDLDIIAARNMPIYLVTADSDALALDKKYSFGTEVLDLRRNTDEISGNLTEDGRRRLQLISALHYDLASSHLMEERLSAQESALLREKNSQVSSFQYFEEIISRLKKPVYWWEKPVSSSLRQFAQDVAEQEPDLLNPTLRAYSTQAFYTGVFSQQQVPVQILDVYLDEKQEGRQEILKVLDDHLHMEPAFQMVDAARAGTKAELDEEWQKKTDTLNAAHEAALRAGEEKFRAQEEETRKALAGKADAERQLAAEKASGREKDSQLSSLNDQLRKKDEELRTYGSRIEEAEQESGRLKGQLARKDSELARKDSELAQKDSELSGKDDQLDKLQDRYDRLKEDKGSGSKAVPIILGVLCAALAAGGGAGIMHFHQESVNVQAQLTDAQEQSRKLQSSAESEGSRADDLQKQLDEAESRAAELESEKTDLAAQLEKAMETEAAPAAPGQSQKQGSDIALSPDADGTGYTLERDQKSVPLY